MIAIDTQNMKFLDLQEFLVGKIENEGRCEGASTELIRAMVTHWLQNPYDRPPHMSADLEIECQIAAHNFRNKNLEEITRLEINDADTNLNNYFTGSRPLPLNLDYSDVPFPPVVNPEFKFIDLFAGIGGFRLGFQNLAGQCVFSSEWDLKAQQTYFRNFGEHPYGDITQIDPEEVPSHDILLGGFPCQAFSVAGYRQGFEDEKGRGNLFFNICDILSAKQPQAFLLENVKNLKGHDKGRTFKRIQEELTNLGYFFESRVLNSMTHGNTPQTRERIFIVGFKDEKQLKAFQWPEKTPLTKSILDLVEDTAPDEFYYNRFPIYSQLKDEINKRGTVYQWRRMYVRENKSNVCPTLTANMGTGGHNVPLILDKKDIRKLTPRECARFQGYPEEYVLPQNMAKSHLYKQIGNSVTVPLIVRLAESIKKTLD